jgi:hypothetical protein
MRVMAQEFQQDQTLQALLWVKFVLIAIKE